MNELGNRRTANLHQRRRRFFTQRQLLFFRCGAITRHKNRRPVAQQVCQRIHNLRARGALLSQPVGRRRLLLRAAGFQQGNIVRNAVFIIAAS